MMKKSLIVCGCVLAFSWSIHGEEQDRLQLSTAEKRLLELTNSERKKKELPPVRPSALLFQVARAHARNMAKQGKMAHVLDGKNPIDRLRAAGYKYRTFGENIAWDSDKSSPESVMKMWMESKIHRDNILNPDVTEMGLGVGPDGQGKLFYAQVLGKPR